MDNFLHRPRRSPLSDTSHARKPVERVEPRTAELPPVVPPPEPDPFLPSNPKKPGKKLSFKLPRPQNKLQWGALIAGIACILAGTGFLVYWFIVRDTNPPVSYVPPVVEEPQEPVKTTVASKTSGREVEPAVNERPVYAVQIENSPEARPQSGLRDADIVSEAVAEGGITRFNALYHDNVPADLGPVRSLRPYYIDWFLPYDAAIVHAGGSAEALADVRALGLKDMDSVPGIMRRISSRYSPHNYYTTGQQVLNLANQRGYTSSVAASLPRKEAAPAEVPTAGTVNLKISSALYNVVFAYDKASNTYLRAQGGAAHIDAVSGQQIAPSVVIVPVMSKSIHPDRVHTKYGTTGSGKVYVFQDGTVTEGIWTKPDRRAQWQLTDAAGQPIKLNPGQTWFTMIDSAAGVTYQ